MNHDTIPHLRRLLILLTVLTAIWSVFVSQHETSSFTLTAFLSSPMALLPVNEIPMMVQEDDIASSGALFVLGLTNEHLTSEKQANKEGPVVIALNATGGATLVFCKQCKKNISCVDMILKQISSVFLPIEIRHAMTDVAEKSEVCHDCHPDSSTSAGAGGGCTAHLLQPLGFDEAAPRLLRTKTFVTLPSIPKERRLPLDVKAYQHNVAGIRNLTDAPLSIYNPSIIVLPRASKGSLEGVYPNATYLASFRATDVVVCGILPDFDWRAHGSNFLALAILDSELNILDDVLLDINQAIQGMGNHNMRFEDYRLFELDGVLHLNAEKYLLPIQVASLQKPLAMRWLIPSIYNHSTNLQVSVPTKKGRLVSRIHNSLPGKNFQFFVDKNGMTWIEFWPQAQSLGRMQLDDPVGVLEIVKGINKPPEYSFKDRQPFKSTGDRGSACCIKLERKYLAPELQQHDFVYLGTSHVRSKPRSPGKNKKVYFSRLYAFVPERPFHLVARSGLFCLGSVDVVTTPQPFLELTMSQQLQVRSIKYDCPQIHYVSGMTTTPGGNTILVTYGILDCVSQIVEIDKEEMARLLFTNLNSVQRVV